MSSTPLSELPPDSRTPSGKRIAVSVVVAIAAAAVILVAAVLPAEYGIDPTGIGRALGLTAMRQPVRTFEVKDVIGGNENVREVEVPSFNDPGPLPNPAVHQVEERPVQTRTMEITLPPEGETEIKAMLAESKVILYTWAVDRGAIYSDMHGHDPAAGSEFFVRYREDQEGSGATGSLVAPFGGEHGWYWLNYNDFPVKVTLTITGFFDEIIDYGIH
jgi:hypothetical protein